MQDINFIPGQGGSKRSKRSQDTPDIQYTSGEAVYAAETDQVQAVPEAKKKAPQPPKQPKNEKKKPAKKKPSFFEWRKQKALTAQEQAEAEEQVTAPQAPKPPKEKPVKEKKKKRRHQDELETGSGIVTPAHLQEPDHFQIHSAPEHKKEEEIKPDLLHAENASQVLAKKQMMHVAPDGVHANPSSDLLHGKVYSMPVTQEVAESSRKEKKSKADKQTKGRSARIHVPPIIESHQAKKHWLTLKKQEADTTIFDVNLIPSDVLAELQTRNYLRELLYIAIAAFMLVLILFAALNVYQRKIATDTAVLETQIQEFDRDIAGYISLQTEVSALSLRLDSVQEVLQAHVYWSPFLETLEDLTLSTVYYQNMSGVAATGNFVFEAYAQSYRDIDAQVRVLRQSPLVRNVVVTSAASTQTTSEEGTDTDESAAATGAVTFDMTVEFDPTLFHYDNDSTL